MNYKENKELDKKFYELHKNIMNQIIKFCEENGIKNADSVSLNSDRVMDSIGFGEWTAATDSGLCLYDEYNNLIIESL